MDKVDNVLVEYMVMDIIKKRPDFSRAINQDRIKKEINELVEQDDFIDTRSVRRVIEGLIGEGYPIISTPVNPGGYCWQGQNGEYIECVNRLRRKAAKIFIRARRIKRNCLREEAKEQGQGVLF